ncbi:hypothetical protein BDN72DRAFT_314689 [Pluteus cervinus]|uniref:Uncharacterized protein n=1 Tax=Pluteus cervinus TaxID=181527 RepID=A0ACD3B4D8_9AGAR|nr:hypothetical protein BDN72DRAFT_314689 [Pluteus cervinus]
MHPQLSDKKDVCREFMQALEACHISTWARLTGGCNKDKDALNTCLRSERVARTTRNRESAKESRVKADEALKKFLS